MKNQTNILFLFLFFSCPIFAQKTLIGKVIDQQQQPIFAANVYWKGATTVGTTTDFDGLFRLTVKQLPDTLIVSFIGYETRQIVVKNLADTLQIALLSTAGLLQEVSIIAQDPISQDFSVIKLDKLQIYTNPLAAGDALKAITLLPSSTNTEETANPVLRGSAGDRSRIVLNGVPIYNPVRNSQLNGLGNFSLFNTEIIEKMYVYASNPPLTFGNSSAGLVEIETTKKLKNNQLQVALSLANVGAFWSKKLGKNNFVQVYGNKQFKEGFIGLNKKNLPRLNHFGTTDFGLNTFFQLTPKLQWKSFAYFIDEGYNYTSHLYTHEGQSKSNKKRGFIINNLTQQNKYSLLTFNTLADISLQDFKFGNLAALTQQQQFFAALNYKFLGLKKITWQTGLHYDYANYQSNDSIPVYFYAMSDTSPNFRVNQLTENHNIEGYFYTSWDITPSFNLSMATRLNIPNNTQKFYHSKQISWRYQPSSAHRWLLSGGNYHNYSTPNYMNPRFVLLDSWQAALDYDYKGKFFELSSAIFYKKEGGEFQLANGLTSQQTETWGVEIALQKEFGKYFSLSLANTFLSQKLQISGKNFKSAEEMPYFIKAVATYKHPKIATFALSYITRKGRYYTPITNAIYQPMLDAYQPIWSQAINSAQYNAYHNLSITANKFFRVGKTTLVVFASVNNLLNSQNEREFLFEKDYKTWQTDTYQLQTVYMGLVWQWNH
jgi:hypothetical protein